MIKNFSSFIEDYYINEERRYVEEGIESEIEKFIGKYKGNEDKIFVSFRSGTHVSMINKNNVFNTPTGIYTYPWKGYFDKIYEQNIKGNKIININNLVPFTGLNELKYIYLYKIKDNAFIVDSNTTYNELKPYAEKIKSIYSNNKFLLQYLSSEEEYFNYTKNPHLNNVCSSCDSDMLPFLKGTIPCPECDGEGYFDGDELCYDCEGHGFIECPECDGSSINNDYMPPSVHIFWVLIYDIVANINEHFTYSNNPYSANNIQTKFTNLCNKIGIDGFVDYGLGYIHPNEKYQGVLFKGRSIIEEYKIIEKDSGMDIISLSSKLLEMNEKELGDFYDKVRPKINMDNIIKHLRKENKLTKFFTKLIEFSGEVDYYSRPRIGNVFLDYIINKGFINSSEKEFIEKIKNQS